MAGRVFGAVTPPPDSQHTPNHCFTPRPRPLDATMTVPDATLLTRSGVSDSMRRSSSTWEAGSVGSSSSMSRLSFKSSSKSSNGNYMSVGKGGRSKHSSEILAESAGLVAGDQVLFWYLTAKSEMELLSEEEELGLQGHQSTQSKTENVHNILHVILGSEKNLYHHCMATLQGRALCQQGCLDHSMAWASHKWLGVPGGPAWADRSGD
ncbi:hypothetical protein BTVI_158761 [Pitangus sulphuratus]|nr:hypothetical protein BTVI_158761 [Pitangus sulphuratus]